MIDPANKSNAVPDPRRALGYAKANRERFIDELKEFIRFPSVSAQPEHAEDVKHCGEWLARHLMAVGLEHVGIIRTPQHPIIYADWLHAPGRPTVLIYGHYDVQPPDPLGEWLAPPFEPVVRGQDIYGRGACDDKGQMMVHVKAVESWLRSTGRLPVNIRCVFEGEEEIGSGSLNALLPKLARELACDVAILSDMPMPAPDQPAITYAMRGALSLEIEVHGPRRDLHSGIFGGMLHNPLEELCAIIASLHDRQGHVAIPGFYDRVRSWRAEERAYMKSAGPSDSVLLADAGVHAEWGEPGFTLYERTTIRPALTVNGVQGGYEGEGGKGVIPSHALAKLSIRLASDQDPHEIEALVRRHIARVASPGVRTVVRALAHACPAYIDRSHPAMRWASAACREVFGKHPVFLRSGGTIPVVESFQRWLGIPTVLLGFALPTDRMHAPNEKFHLPNFYNGIATSIHFLARAGAMPGDRDGLCSRPSFSTHQIAGERMR